MTKDTKNPSHSGSSADDRRPVGTTQVSKTLPGGNSAPSGAPAPKPLSAPQGRPSKAPLSKPDTKPTKPAARPVAPQALKKPVASPRPLTAATTKAIPQEKSLASKRKAKPKPLPLPLSKPVAQPVSKPATLETKKPAIKHAGLKIKGSGVKTPAPQPTAKPLLPEVPVKITVPQSVLTEPVKASVEKTVQTPAPVVSKKPEQTNGRNRGLSTSFAATSPEAHETHETLRASRRAPRQPQPVAPEHASAQTGAPIRIGVQAQTRVETQAQPQTSRAKAPTPAAPHQPAPAAPQPELTHVAKAALQAVKKEPLRKRKPTPRLERHYLPAGEPRPRASLAEKSKAPSIGGLIHSMEAKPSKTPFLIAAITSFIWLFIGGLLGWLLVGQSLGDFSGYQAVLGSPSAYILAASILVPIALFWFIAQLIWRSQEMKLIASAMTEVAVRLAEPDKMAEQRVASVGQTIRRQVSAMDDAISRALGRAGELESLVHNEVAALERSYSQNEFIIRNLLNELVSERQAIAQNGQEVKDTLQGVGAQVSNQIRVATDGIDQQLTQHSTRSALKLQQVGNQTAAALHQSGGQITAALQKSGDQASAALKQSGGQITTALQQSGGELTAVLQKTGDQASAALQKSGDQVTTAMKSTTDQTMAIKQKIAAELPELLTKMNTEQDRLGKVIEGASQNLGRLDKQLGERTAEIDTVIGKHTGELNKRLAQKVKALDASLAMRTKTMDQTLANKAKDIDASFATHREAIDTTMQKKAVELDQSIAQQAKAMDASLTAKARTIDTALTQRMEDLKTIEPANALPPATGETEQSEQASQKPDQQNSSKESNQTTAQPDLSMLRGSEALEKAMAQQSDEMAQTFENNSAELDRTIEKQNELSPEIAALTQKHDQLLADHVEHVARVQEQFAKEGDELLATARLLTGPDMRMSAMMGPQQNKARAILSDIAARSERMEKNRRGLGGALENSLTLSNDTAQALKQQLIANASPRAQQAIKELEQKSTGNQTHTLHITKELVDHQTAISHQVVEMVSAMSRSSSRTKVLPGAVANTSANIRKTVQEQMQALDALAQISGTAVSSSQATVTGTGAGLGGTTASNAIQNGVLSSSNNRGQNSLRAALAHGPATTPSPGQAPAGSPSGKPPSQWSFGDLLARVADTEGEQGEEPLPRYRPASASSNPSSKTQLALDPLDILRMDDIARALDSHTAALAWQRHQSGERNVFSRRLYSPEGQQTFDQISERYHNDSEFRVTVAKYVTDFEGLMTLAEEKDPSGRIIQNYLTSETGRVYLMLAHISGHLG